MSHDIVDAVGFEPTFFAVLLIQILPLPRGAVTRIHLAENVGVDPNTFYSTICFQDKLAGRCNSFSKKELTRSSIIQITT